MHVYIFLFKEKGLYHSVRSSSLSSRIRVPEHKEMRPAEEAADVRQHQHSRGEDGETAHRVHAK